MQMQALTPRTRARHLCFAFADPDETLRLQNKRHTDGGVTSHPLVAFPGSLQSQDMPSLPQEVVPCAPTFRPAAALFFATLPDV